ncbi:MAG: hypothetical protein JXQ73_18990 [Phycisphaerae bacterium]|nr:hypothetical protein [Phycisphaerae bacterium]
MNQQNFVIGVLSVTATILLVGVILLGTAGQHEAQAMSQVDKGGDYILLTSLWRSNAELLWVLDGRSQILGLYYFEPRRARLELADTIDLAAGQQQQQQP